jgi:hypothetical protein
MAGRIPTWCWTAGFAAALVGLALRAGGETPRGLAEKPGEESTKKPAEKPAFRNESLRGRAVWLAEALKDRFGVETDKDAVRSVVALATTDGRLLPIVKDFRGRGFYSDARLREMDLELLVRTFEGASSIQVVRVYSIKDGAKYEVDYWCDICSIPMYELKECECCQGEIRIRQRLVEKRDPARSTPAKGQN